MDEDMGTYKDFPMDVDMLVEMGVEPIDAQRYMFKLTKNSNQVTFHEFYGRGTLVEQAELSSFNVKGLRSLDFANVKPDGSRWDFRLKKDRHEAMRLVELEDPDWIIGAPPCTAFSVLFV